jgi:hypothetical protein
MIALFMKKLVPGLLIVVILFLGSVYCFFPSNLTISNIMTIDCTRDAAYRLLSAEANWKRWWDKRDDSSYSPKGGNFSQDSKALFRLQQTLTNGVGIVITNDGIQYPGVIELLSKAPDSVVLNWKCNIYSGLNPVKKISRYRQAVALKKIVTDGLNDLCTFLENKENVYSMGIIRSSTTDTLLIATKYLSRAYPSTDEIYKTLAVLRQYITRQGARETGHPMLNVTRLAAGQFQTMIALPTSVELQGSGAIFSRRLVHGSFMISHIIGGPATVNNAVEQMQLYFDDYKKTSVAIPFQSLVTDRSAEKDTSKWVTDIYAPVM